jgi:hypothetical protein
MAAAKKGKTVARYTTVADTTYAPGDEVSAEHAELIDNPAVWEADDADASDD